MTGLKRYFIVALAGLALTACDNTEPPAEPDNRDLYLQVVRDEYPSLENVDDQALVDFAVAACDAFEAGATAEQVVSTVAGGAMAPSQGGFLLGAGIQAYCPEYSDELLDLGAGV